ncbi:hypothetical protein NA78x_000811 [Anatilimnocola sp. NA78]|uniref:hypothetical protein n=1 Tax=Anatilimnocola sp. NA78 TaxID=3415683 RepID=UPI003CE4795E
MFVLTLLTGFVLQSGISVWEHRQAQRRTNFACDVRALVGGCQELDPRFAPCLLKYVERRIATAPEASLLTPRQQRQLSQLIECERVRQRRVAQNLESNRLVVARDE